MSTHFRLFMLISLCLVGSLLIAANARCDAATNHEATSDGVSVETGSYPILGSTDDEVTLHYHNFDPESDEAKRGLRYLYKSNLLVVKGGFSVRALQNMSKIPILKNYGNVGQYDDAAYQWRQYGYLPSPASRTAGKLPGQSHFPIQVNVFPLGDNGYVTNENRGLLTLGCFTCHAGVIGGQVIAGMGNNYVNLRPYLDDNKNLRTLRNTIKLNPLWKSSSIARFGMTPLEVMFLELEINYFENVLTPMLKTQVTRGVITGPASTLTYLT